MRTTPSIQLEIKDYKELIEYYRKCLLEFIPKNLIPEVSPESYEFEVHLLNQQGSLEHMLMIKALRNKISARGAAHFSIE